MKGGFLGGAILIFSEAIWARARCTWTARPMAARGKYKRKPNPAESERVAGLTRLGVDRAKLLRVVKYLQEEPATLDRIANKHDLRKPIQELGHAAGRGK